MQDLPYQKRFVNLWELMQPILLQNVSGIFAQLSQLEQVASTSPTEGDVPKAWREHVANWILFQAFMVSAEINLGESVEAIARLKKALLEDEHFSNQELLWKLHALRELMESEMSKRLYVAIPKNVSKYFEKERPFGYEVFQAFPSARFDITQAGTCLACGVNTAAALHMMRASEIGLWELGKDRQIALAQAGKIEFSEWGQIISELEDTVKAIQQWPNKPSKEEAHKFYNSTLVEIRAFNDGFRRHIAHVRKTQKPLEADEALALWGHVSRFLGTLATKISEGTYTPLVWS